MLARVVQAIIMEHDELVVDIVQKSPTVICITGDNFYFCKSNVSRCRKGKIAS